MANILRTSLQTIIDIPIRAVTVLVVACTVSMSLVHASEAPRSGAVDIATHYRITSTSLQTLPALLEAQASGQLGSVREELDLETYIGQLDTTDYAAILASFVRQQNSNSMTELVDAEFARFYELFIDSISEADFAAIYRDYLGALTADYLISASSQDFTQYVLSRILRLTPGAYSDLYRNYIATLWSYYVADTSEEELRRLLGEDYAALTATDDLTIEDERYFDLLIEHLTTIDEAEFVSEYRAYVTEIIGGLVDDVGEDSAGAGFTELSAAESIGLLRRHIASIARDHFAAPFRADMLREPGKYVAGVSPEALASLASLPGLIQIVEQRLAEFNADIRQTNNYVSELLDPAFIEQVMAEMRFVANIPYPNVRLLRIAVEYALSTYVRAADSDNALTESQYQIVLQAIMETVVSFDEAGLAGLQTETGDRAANISGSISWDFLGCGCEIELSRVIYGFYPTWSMPQPGTGPQAIDFRFYDRVAYFGLTLDSSGRISDDEFWREGGAMNDFIQGGHVRNTRIDLAVYAPTWNSWTDANMNIAATNVVDKLSIPLRFNFYTTFANSYLAPIYPTYSETVGKNTMGDGLALYFDNLEDPVTGQVRDLETIERFVLLLDNLLGNDFEDDEMPIHLILDFSNENAEAVFSELRHLIVGTPDSPNEFVSRVLVFLEQDTWNSSQNLLRSIRSVFKDDNSAAVLQKLNPILIPAMDEPGEFVSLERDLEDFRWSFGEHGGAAIWPMPLQDLEEDALIEATFREAMVDNSTGVWRSIEVAVQRIYFRARLELIFSMTFVFILSLAIFAYSIREPVRPWILWTAKILGGVSFVAMLVSWYFLDPYINNWRIAFFVGMVLLLLLIPFQPAVPEAAVDLTQNRLVGRQVKRQKNRGKRKLRTLVRNLWGNRGGD